MAVAFSRQNLKPEIQCVSAESPEHCMEQIQVRCRGLGTGAVVCSAWYNPHLSGLCGKGRERVL